MRSRPDESPWSSSTRSSGSSASRNSEGVTAIMSAFSLPSTTTTIITRDPRWLSLVVLCAGMLMIVLDATIVNVALPSIRSDLGFTQSSLAWVVNAYLIAFGGVLLLAGRLGDLLGRRRVFLAGLAVLPAACLLCGCSRPTGGSGSPKVPMHSAPSW